MNAQFLAKYSDVLFDKQNRINANLSRMKNYKQLCDDLYEISKSLPDEISIKDRLWCVVNNISTWPTCEVCDKNVKLINKKFTPFCCFKCSRSKGSSTFSKAQDTCIKKYGVKSNLVTKEALQKKRDSGGIGAGNINTALKIKNTNLLKYGVENVFADKQVKEKIKQTHDTKYGGNYHSIKLGYKLELLNDKSYCENLAKNHCMSSICDILGVSSNTIYKYFELHNIKNFNRQYSNQEKEVYDFISSIYKGEIVTGNRKLIAPYELDIFIPEKNLAIELNGLYWHSDKAGCKPSYHLTKTKMAQEKNIQLIHIFENEWVLKKDIVKSRIQSILNLNQHIYARKCIVKEITSKDKKTFINENHIQGDCNTSINYGLFFNDELVACMTFSKSRFEKNIDFELVRFCSKKYINVIGGFAKLLAHFRKYNSGSIVSFADLRWSIGNVYKQNNFKYVSTSAPSYHYFKNSSIILENRLKFQKHKLSKILQVFDNSKSEWENMKLNNYNKIYDCGNTKWILE